MLKRIVNIFMILAVSFAAKAIDENKNIELNNFIGIKAGIIQPTPLYGNTGMDTGKNTFATGIKIGRKLFNFFSIDIEYIYREANDTDESTPGEINSSTWSIKSDTLMLNFTLDFLDNAQISPYLRGGIGNSINKSYMYSSYDQTTKEFSYYPGKSSNNFAWQIGTGINFDINSKLSTEIEYMYIDRGSVETQAFYIDYDNIVTPVKAIKGDFSDHMISIGLKLRF